MSSSSQATDLSMDEILASIRKIIAEEPKSSAGPQGAGAQRAVHPGFPQGLPPAPPAQPGQAQRSVAPPPVETAPANALQNRLAAAIGEGRRPPRPRPTIDDDILDLGDEAGKPAQSAAAPAPAARAAPTSQPPAAPAVAPPPPPAATRTPEPAQFQDLTALLAAERDVAPTAVAAPTAPPPIPPVAEIAVPAIPPEAQSAHPVFPSLNDLLKKQDAPVQSAPQPPAPPEAPAAARQEIVDLPPLPTVAVAEPPSTMVAKAPEPAAVPAPATGPTTVEIIAPKVQARPAAQAEPQFAAPIASANPEARSAPPEVAPASQPPVVAETPAPASPPAVRTLEDTVAELLRPVLRQWLDDNMPRIVEKAFREELAGRAKK
jgi:cell pole-organizing protein PopZ